MNRDSVMSRRRNILARLRRFKSRGAAHVITTFAVAYLLAGVAPCAAASSGAFAGTAIIAEQAEVSQHRHAQHESHDVGAHAQHGHGDGGLAAPHVPAPSEHGGDHCPHCPAAVEGASAAGHGGDHRSCAALEDLTNAAASHAKDAPQPSAVLIVAAPFTQPPPLASPLLAQPPVIAAIRASNVPLNVRHCVFLI
jgi:hypothetical protein